jgi:hypothetical protein
LPASTAALHRNQKTHASPRANQPSHAAAELKPNYAIRTAPSLDDSPDHVSLAMSPALSLRARGLGGRAHHHRMVHGRAYAVSAVLDVRVKDGQVEYLVGWEGFPDFFNSWEPAHSLMQACTARISDFEQRMQEEEGAEDDDERDDEGQQAMRDAALSPSPSPIRVPTTTSGGDGSGDSVQGQQEGQPPQLKPEGPPLSSSSVGVLLSRPLALSSAAPSLTGMTGDGDEEEDDDELASLHQAHVQRQQNKQQQQQQQQQQAAHSALAS